MPMQRINRWLWEFHDRVTIMLSGWVGVVLFVASLAFLIACAIWLD